MGVRLAVTILALAATACSLILTFEYEEDPRCSNQGKCLSGYSCQINRCVANGSVEIGDTCTASVQCESTLCATAPYVCRQRCQAAYANTSECSPAQGCMRITDPGDIAAGACTPSQCTTTCAAGEACVFIRNDAGVCETPCTVLCSPGPACTHTCAALFNCQPVGANQTLVCIPEGAGVHGDPCSMVDQLCDANHACIRPPDGRYGLCLHYCDPAVAGACNGFVDPATGGQALCNPASNGTFNFCGALPSSPVAIGTQCGDGLVHGLEMCDGAAWPTAGPGPDCFDFGLAAVAGTHTARCVNCVPNFATCEFRDYCVRNSLDDDASNICHPCLELGDIEDPDCTFDCATSANGCSNRYFFNGTTGAWTCQSQGRTPDPDCTLCGNAAVDGAELCDSSAVAPFATGFGTCSAFGFVGGDPANNGGILRCGTDCMPRFNNCIQ